MGVAGIGLATLAALSTLDETLPPGRHSLEPLSHALVEYGRLLRHRRLLAYAGKAGFVFGGTFAYVAASPFAYISLHHHAPQLYGLLFGAGIVGIMTTSTARLAAGSLDSWGETACLCGARRARRSLRRFSR